MQVSTMCSFKRDLWMAALAGALATAAASPPMTAGGAAANSEAADIAVSRDVRLESLVDEAMRRSPIVLAARLRWEASARVPVQVSTLPDPEISLQEFTVGGPRPLEGYETSDFYYTGFGASQDIPWPSKLRLQAAQARADVDYARQAYEAAKRDVAEKVRESYFELFFADKALDILGRTHEELKRVERAADARYRLGEGQQQDLSKAQLEMTMILEQIEMRRQEVAQRQAELKTFLGRDPGEPDIEIGEIEATSDQRIDSEPLGRIASENSPEVKMARAMEDRSAEGLKLARANYIPDFSLSYSYQKTGPGLRDYYMLTAGARVPLYFWRKQTPAAEQAALGNRAAHADARARELEIRSTAESQKIAMLTSSRLMTLYRDGLIPQARATQAAALNAYRVGKIDFQTLLSAEIDVLNLDQGYYRALADHEIAVAKIERITGDRP